MKRPDNTPKPKKTTKRRKPNLEGAKEILAAAIATSTTRSKPGPRPRPAGVNRSCRVSVRLRADEYQRLLLEADQAERTIADYLRRKLAAQPPEPVDPRQITLPHVATAKVRR